MLSKILCVIIFSGFIMIASAQTAKVAVGPQIGFQKASCADNEN